MKVEDFSLLIGATALLSYQEAIWSTVKASLTASCLVSTPYAEGCDDLDLSLFAEVRKTILSDAKPIIRRCLVSTIDLPSCKQTSAWMYF
jgi:hypothetical protein